MRLKLIGGRFPHHATHSGYHRIAEFLGVECHASSDAALPAADLLDFIYADASYRETRFRLPAGSKLVGTFHQPPSILARLGFIPALVKSLDAVMVVGSAQRGYFEKRGARRIETVKHGIDCSFFHPGPPSMTQRHRVLTVGHWLRDMELYFRVVRQAARWRLPLAFHLVSRGAALPRALPANCIVHSDLDDQKLREQYRRAACLFLPLVDVTACNALLEAIACGTPYLASDVGSVRDYVDESGGVLLANGKEGGWIDALMALTRLTVWRRERSAAARALALRLNWPAVAAAIKPVYADIAATGSLQIKRI